MTSFVKCYCGGEAIYDADGCGHEWVTCSVCKFEIERYQTPDIADEWETAVRASNKGRRYLIVRSNDQ